MRRLEAITGRGALERFRAAEEILGSIQVKHNVLPTDISSNIDKLHLHIRDLERQIGDLKLQNMRANLTVWLAAAREIQGVKVFAQMLPEIERAGMRAFADELKDRIGSGVIILGAPQENKVALVVMVTRDLAPRLPAGKIIREIAPIVGGSGGGKPELAEAGGKDCSRLADAIERSYAIVEKLLAGK